MDFSALIAELRNIASSYNGRDIDSNVSTAMYCEMFRKILQKAESEVAAYDDQIVILWMTLSQLCQTYKTLTKCKERNDLYQHIFLLCAKVVLNIKWQQLADDDQSKENFRKTVEATHSQLVHAGFDRFGLLLNIMENPWTDPTITKIMSGDVEEESNSDTEEDENEMSDERKKELEERKKKKIQERDEEFTKYIGLADPLILRLRVEMLMQENCEEWALNLCNCCLKQRRYQMDLEFKSMQLLLLFKLGSMEKLQEVCETIECHHGIYIIEKLEKKENNQSLCVRLIQIFLVQDWIRPDRNCCTKKLLQMWIKYQSMEDKDRDKFLDSVWAIAKISSSTDQVNQLVTGLVKKCGLNLLQLYTDLCVYAINFDKGCCEQQMIQGNMEGVKKQQWAISVTCIKLADLYCNCSPKLARIAALTAFSLNPTIQNFNVVRKTFTDKRKEKMQAVKQDLSEEKGKETPQKEYRPRQSKYLQKVNPATIHEVERLLNMLRPYYLDPEIGFEKLQPVCQKFMDERGGGISELPKKPNRPQTKTNSNSPRQNADVQFGSDNSAGSSRSNCAPTKSKNPPITAQSAPSPASSLAKSPLFGNKPRSYRAMSQPETVSKPPKTVQSNAIAQRLVPLIQPSPTPQTKTTSIDSTSNISELLKATKTLPQYNPNSSPATSLSYTSSSFVSVPQRMSGVNTQVQSTDLLRRKSVTLPVSTGGAFGRSEIIGDAGDKSIYHHLYKPLKPQEPTSLKTAKPPSNKLQVTNVNNKFQGHPNSYSLGGQANFNSIARPAEGASFAPPAAGVDSRRPSAEELQSIVDWLQSGTEDAISKQNIASFNTAIQQTPPPAHTPQPSYAARGQAVHNSQAHSTLQSGQKVDLNTLLTKPQVVANVLKIHPKGKTAVQEAASQISQRLSDIRSQGDVQLLLNLQKKYGSHQKPVPPNSAPNSDQPVHKKSVNDTKGKKNLTDTDLSLEEMKRRIADIVQKQKLLCENKPDQPAKRRRSDSPKGKKKTTGSSSSTPTKGLKPASSPAAVATATSESSNTPPQGEVQKQQIKEWFNNRLQVQQQIEKIKQQPPSISSLTKPQFILQQQAAPVHFVSASQIENLRSSSAQRGAGNPRASEGPALHGSPGPPQQKVDHYDQRLGLLSNSASTKPSLLEQKLLQDDSATTASLKDSSMLSSSIPQTPNIHQLRTFQASAQSVSNEGVLPSQLHLPLPNSQANTTGVSQGPGISEGTLPSSDGPTPTTLLSVLLEQSKYITSVAATSASSSPSQSKNFQGGSSQVNTSTWSSTLSNSVLSSLPSTPTSASPIRTSAQQTLSILLPKTAHCGKQDVENSNSDSTSTSSTVDSREKPKDSSLMSPVGYQLKYVGQIKTRDIQSVAKSGNDLLGGNTSGQSIQKSPSGMKLLTCFDNEVVKEISKMIGGEKKQAMPPVEIPIISKPQQQMENVDSVHCVSVKNNTENSFVTENKQMGEKEVSRLESLGTVVPNEKPTPLTDLKATSEQSQVGVKNYRQSLIDSLENGIKQSMEHIDVSAELLEKSSQNIHPSCIDLDLTREKVPECSESVGDISSTAQPVLPNVQVVQEESTEKLSESQTCVGEMVDHGADSGPKMSSESQTWTDKTIEHGANSDRNSSPLSPAAQPTTHIDQIDPLVSESGSKTEEEWSQEKTDIPVNFGFDFNEESHGEEMKINKKSSSEDSSSRESEFVKVSPPESKHKRLQGSAILKTKKRYRENLQGAKEVAEKIKEHIISGTKVVEITEKTALPSVIETKAFSADVKKNMPASARVNDPDFDKHSIASNSSSCSSVPSINQMQTIQSNPEKEKGTKEIPEKTNNCLICGKEFRSVMSLKEHVKNKCKSTDYVRTKDYEFSSRFTCCKCGMTSSSPYDMKKHLKRQHNMSDDKDFEDLLISSYKCELCGETFKDKTSIYSHVSTSCPHLGARRKESKLFPDDKRAVKTLPNLVNPNRGKLSSATTNQSPPNNVGFKEKVPVAKAEIQRQPKTVSREMKATEVISVKSENTKILSQERASSPVETAIGKSQIGEKNSEENASLSSQEESQTDSKKKTEPQVSNQRVTRSRLENTSTKKESGTNNAKGTKQQVVAEKSGKKVGEDPMKEDNHVEDSCRKLSFDESQNKASVEEEKGPEKSNKKDRSTERKRTNKESPELKTPTARGQTRGKNGKFTPRSSAVPSNEKKEDDSTDLSNSNQDKSQTSKLTYRRHTRSKGTVENVDLSDLEKVEMNFRKSRCRQYSGSTDVSLVSECSEVDQQQKLSEQTKRKKLDNDSCEGKSTSSPAVVAESGQDASSSQRKRKESSSVQPPVETPSRGKRLIKVKKFDQFEVPEFLKSQVINSNLKRQVKTEKVPDKVIQTPAKNETKKEIRKCSRCSKQFANQTKLIKHIATVHLTPCKPSSSSRLQKCSYQCRYCKATYKTYLQFLNHVPGHATQILEGLDSKQIVPAVVHSKPANVKGTEDSGPQKEETENIIKKEEAEENEVKTRSTRQSENKAKPVNEPTENTVATRSRRSTASSENGQGDKANQKAKSSSTSRQEKQVLTSRSRSRSGRGLDNKEEKPEVDLNSPSRQLRRKRDSRGNEKDNDVLKKKQNMQQDNQNIKAQEKQLPQTEEHMTRSSAKRKSESNKSPAPSKKSKTDQPDSTECETSPEKVPVAVVDDDEFEYVKSPSHETTFNEASKATLHKASEVKEKIVLSRSSKDHTAYLNSFMSYIDNRSKKTKEEKEKVAKTLQQPNKKTVPNKKARLDTDRDNSTDTEEKGTTSGTPNQAPTSFLDSFLEHCSKATDGEMSSPSGSVKGEDTKAGEDHVATKTEQKQVKSESKPDAEVKEETACVIGNVDSKVTEAGDKTSFNAFQDTFKSFVTAGSKKGSISGEGDSSTRKESLTDVIEGLRDSERTHRAGSEESVQTVSSRCTDISDTSEGAQGSTASKSKRMRHIYHNGKIWHVGAGNVTSMSVKQNDPEGHPLPSSTLTNPITPGMTLATKQLIKVDRDKNTPHQDQSENTYTYTTAEELKRGSQGGSNKWRVKRDKTQLSFRK
uniref:C2H2-type domain-containing protein n=1 Tax=Magallana gigas TaxID=29159 RepID=K1PPI0_MAGGI